MSFSVVKPGSLAWDILIGVSPETWAKRKVFNMDGERLYPPMTNGEKELTMGCGKKSGKSKGSKGKGRRR